MRNSPWLVLVSALLAVAAAADGTANDAAKGGDAATSDPDPARPQRLYAVTLSEVRVSRLDGGRLAVSLVGAGDIRGLVSFTIEPDAEGALSGQWALVSRYHLDLGDPGTPEGDHDLHPEHPEAFVIHERGTLSGPITGGELIVDGDGRATGIRALRMEIKSGSIEFRGARGTASAEDVDFGADGGHLRLDVRGGRR